MRKTGAGTSGVPAASFVGRGLTARVHVGAPKSGEPSEGGVAQRQAKSRVEHRQDRVGQEVDGFWGHQPHVEQGVWMEIGEARLTYRRASVFGW